jgi:hypothetical protein
MFVFLFLAAHFDVSLLLLFSVIIVPYVSLFFHFLSLVAGFGFGQNMVRIPAVEAILLPYTPAV